MDRRNIVLVCGLTASALLAWFVLSPFTAPYGAYTHLDGSPGILDHSWSAAEFPYLLGDFLCHQEMDRSFILNGSQLPFCIRDIGLLLGLAAGLVLCYFLDRRLGDKKVLWLSVLMIAVTGVEWLAEQAVGDMPEARFLTGIVTGAGAALLLGWMFYRDTE